jgi:hypothetical protein
MYLPGDVRRRLLSSPHRGPETALRCHLRRIPSTRQHCQATRTHDFEHTGKVLEDQAELVGGVFGHVELGIEPTIPDV